MTMRVNGLAALVCAALMLLACSDKQKELLENPTMKGAFDASAAAYIDKLGTGTISGRTFHQVSGSTVYSGKHASLQLVPVTAYSNEYFNLLFGNNKAYYAATPVENVDPGFRRYMRRTRADGEGNYEFPGVPPGDYYVYSQITENRTGVALYERVTIADGQKIRLDVSGK
ncbi:MAG: carboxypeptidase-like regulatory domain-containing protein [Hyphomicrobiales bacterium]